MPRTPPGWYEKSPYGGKPVRCGPDLTKRCHGTTLGRLGAPAAATRTGPLPWGRPRISCHVPRARGRSGSPCGARGAAVPAWGCWRKSTPTVLSTGSSALLRPLWAGACSRCPTWAGPSPMRNSVSPAVPRTIYCDRAALGGNGQDSVGCSRHGISQAAARLSDDIETFGSSREGPFCPPSSWFLSRRGDCRRALTPPARPRRGPGSCCPCPGDGSGAALCCLRTRGVGQNVAFPRCPAVIRPGARCERKCNGQAAVRIIRGCNHGTAACSSGARVPAGRVRR